MSLRNGAKLRIMRGSSRADLMDLLSAWETNSKLVTGPGCREIVEVVLVMACIRCVTHDTPVAHTLLYICVTHVLWSHAII